MHGEAVAYGMAYEAKMSLETLKLKKDDFQLIQELLEKFEFNKQLNVSFSELKPFIKIDKKNTSNLVNLVQLKAIGECKIIAIKNTNNLQKFF